MPNRDAIIGVGTEIERQQASCLKKFERFTSGFFKGNVNSTEAMAGTVVSDFLIIGDLRDLGQQGYNAAAGKDVDGMIVALSSVGVLASAASYIPEPGEPAVAGVDAGISLLKGLRKINALTNHFAGEVMKMASEALKTKRIGRVAEVTEHLGTLAKRVPAGTMGTAMKNVESVEDLKVISRWATIAPNETIVALAVPGHEAANWLKSSRNLATKQLSQILRKGATGFTTNARGTKFIYRGRLQQMANSLSDWFTDHPQARNALLMIALGGLLLSLLFAVSSVCRLLEFIRGSKRPEFARPERSGSGQV
jgi:hypothetical protein